MNQRQPAAKEGSGCCAACGKSRRQQRRTTPYCGPCLKALPLSETNGEFIRGLLARLPRRFTKRKFRSFIRGRPVEEKNHFLLTLLRRGLFIKVGLSKYRKPDTGDLFSPGLGDLRA